MAVAARKHEGTGTPALNASPTTSRSASSGPTREEINRRVNQIQVGLLTGGGDKSYALGLATSLVSQGVFVDFIGSDSVDAPELHGTRLISFLNLRGDQRENVSVRAKVVRVLIYYFRLLRYAAVAKPRILHILWNNKFEFIDRVLLMLYYRSLGKRVVFTAHNVNTARRDGKDNAVNRLTLRIQYHLCHHIFVHTEKMKHELVEEFDVPERRVSVIPFGINNTLPVTTMTSIEAKRHLGFGSSEKLLLFFGQIAPYKGLEYLIAAFDDLAKNDENMRLVIAGKVKKGYAQYWEEIQHTISRSENQAKVIKRVEHIPDEEVEVYFKAADVLVVPYTQIYQSGVPFLAYSFGLPVVGSDVGSLKDDIIEEKTGFVCRPQDSSDLARSLEVYFSSEMYEQLDSRRQEIRDFANEKYSWAKVGRMTFETYVNLLVEDGFAV